MGTGQLFGLAGSVGLAQSRAVAAAVEVGAEGGSALAVAGSFSLIDSLEDMSRDGGWSTSSSSSLLGSSDCGCWVSRSGMVVMMMVVVMATAYFWT